MLMTEERAIRELEALRLWASIKREAAVVTGPTDKELRYLCIQEALQAALDLLEGAREPDRNKERDHMGVRPLEGATCEL